MELAKATALLQLTRDALRQIFFDKLDIVFLGFILFALIFGGRVYTRSLRGRTFLGHYGDGMLWVYSA